MKNNLDIKDIINPIKKYKHLILLVTLVAIIVSSIITFFGMTPKYEASTQILVNQNQDSDQSITSQEVQSNRELINTYNVIMTSPAILEPVIENTSSEISVNELRDKITVEAEADSQIATITVEDESQRQAVNLANTIARVFEEEVTNIMNVDNVSILSEAQMNEELSPISPKPLLNIVTAIIFGLMLSLGLAFLIEYLDKSIKTEQDIEKEIGMPVLGVVPVMSEKDMKTALSNKKTNLNSRSKVRENEKKSHD